MTDPECDPAAALHEHLAATEERPVERAAGWRLGEAQALAADIAIDGVDGSIRAERAAEIRTLLEGIDETGDSEADNHVAAARELASRIADRTGSE